MIDVLYVRQVIVDLGIVVMILLHAGWNLAKEGIYLPPDQDLL